MLLNWTQMEPWTRSGESLHFVYFDTLRGGLADVFWVVVLLHNPAVLNGLKVTKCFSDIFIFLLTVSYPGS